MNTATEVQATITVKPLKFRRIRTQRIDEDPEMDSKIAATPFCCYQYYIPDAGPLLVIRYIHECEDYGMLIGTIDEGGGRSESEREESAQRLCNEDFAQRAQVLYSDFLSPAADETKGQL